MPETPRFLNRERTPRDKGIESGKRKGDKKRGGNQCSGGSAVNQHMYLYTKSLSLTFCPQITKRKSGSGLNGAL